MYFLSQYGSNVVTLLWSNVVVQWSKMIKAGWKLVICNEEQGPIWADTPTVTTNSSQALAIVIVFVYVLNYPYSVQARKTILNYSTIFLKIVYFCLLSLVLCSTVLLWSFSESECSLFMIPLNIPFVFSSSIFWIQHNKDSYLPNAFLGISIQSTHCWV